MAEENDGAPDVDGVTFEAIEAQGVEVFLEQIRDELTAHPEIPWREITGMRHRLIHGYAELRLDLVWAVLGERLGALVADLARLVPGENDSGL